MLDKLFNKKKQDEIEESDVKIRTIEAPIDSKPTMNRINIIRMVLDHAQYEIDALDLEIAELDDRKERLVQKKKAHEEMLAVAKKFS